MTSPAGRMAVEIIGDASKLGPSVQAEINRAMRGVTVDTKPIGDKIADGVKAGIDEGSHAFSNLNDAADKSFDEVGRTSVKTFDKISADANHAGDQVGDDVAKGGERAEAALGEVGDKSQKEFARVVGNAQDASGGIGAIFKKLGGVIIAAFAAVQVGQFFISATTSAEDLGSAIANTIQILKATGSAAKLTADDVRALSKSLSIKIGVDSVEVQNAANVLLTFRGISGPVLTEAIGLAADLSGVFGTDLAGSATQLGKALNDPILGITALTRVGVSFTQQQKDQIKALQESGDLLGAQRVVLDEIAKEVGGVAEAGADTTDKLKVAFEDLKRAAGGAIIGLVDEAGPALLSLADSLAPVFSTVGTAVATVLQAVLPLLGPLTSILAPVAAIVAAIATGLVPVIASLSPLISGLGALVSAVFTPLAPIIAMLGQTIGAILLPVMTLLGGLFTQLAPVIGTIVSAIGSALAPIFAALGPLVVTIVEALAPLIPVLITLLPPIVEIVVALTPLILLFAQLIGLAAQIIAPFGGLLAVVVGFLASKAIVPLISLLAQGLAFILQPLTKLTPLIESFSKWIQKIDWRKVGAAIGGAFADAWRAVVAFFVGIGRWFGSIPDMLGRFGSAIGAAFGKALDAVGGFFAGIGSWFASLPGLIGGFLASLPGLFVAGLGAMFDAGLHAIGVGIGLLLAAFILFPHLVINALFALPGLVADVFTAVWTWAINTWRAGGDAVVGFAVGLPGRIWAAISALGPLIGSLISGIWTWVIDTWRAGGDAVVGFAIGLPPRIWAALQSLGALIGGAFSSALSWARSAVVDGFNGIVGYVMSVPGRIAGLAGQMLQAGLALIRGLMSGLGQAGNFVGDLAGRITGAIKGFLNQVIGRINSGIASVDDALPGISLPRIPSLATGGLTTRSGLANLHPRELVLPLEDTRATDLLARALAEADAGLRATGVLSPDQSTTAPPEIHVYIGETELTNMITVVMSERDRRLRQRVQARTGAR